MNIFEEVKKIALRGVIPPTRGAHFKNGTPEICKHVKPDYVCLGLNEYAEFIKNRDFFTVVESFPNAPERVWDVEIIRTGERSHFSYGWKI